MWNTASATKLDTDIFPLIEPLLFEDYQFLVPRSHASEKRAIIAGEVFTPTFTYTRLPSEDKVRAWKAQLATLERAVARHTDELVRRAYEPKLMEIRARIELLVAACEGDDVGFGVASRKLYPDPNNVTSRYTLDVLQKRCAEVEGSSYATQIPYVLERVRAWLSKTSVNTEASVFDPATLPKRVLDTTSAISAEDIRSLCIAALDEHSIPHWRVNIGSADGSHIFNVNHESRTVVVPHDDHLRKRHRPMTKMRAEALIAHEIGTHIVRRYEGEQSPLLLLGRGLANYLQGEEGLATYVEQRITGADDYAGDSGYLSLMLARGSADDAPRGFIETHTMLADYLVLDYVAHALEHGMAIDTEQMRTSARERAWAMCLRIFRGTSGTTPGAVFGKDVVYRDGNIAIWREISSHAERLPLFFAGKYDPTNLEHVRLVRELGLPL